MNGPQDMGGMMGFGPVRPEIDEPVFHEEWERRALALTLATDACGEWNIDVLRPRGSPSRRKFTGRCPTTISASRPKSR